MRPLLPFLLPLLVLGCRSTEAPSVPDSVQVVDSSTSDSGVEDSGVEDSGVEDSGADTDAGGGGDSGSGGASEERCNGLDDDGDAVVDEEAADASTWYLDHDGDGFGAVESAVVSCEAPSAQHVAQPWDCDDDNPEVHGDALEVCDGLDNNCDGLIDEDDGFAQDLVYVVTRYDGHLQALDRETGELVWAAEGLGGMIGVAAASTCDVYVSQLKGTVSRVWPDGSSEVIVDVDAGLNGPHGLWWDASTETLLLGGYWDDSVHEIDPATGSLTTLVSDLGRPVGVYREAGDDRVFITQRTSTDLLVWDGSTGEAEVFASLPSTGDIITPDGQGNLYVSSGSGQVYRVTPEGEVSALPGSWSGSYGSCWDAWEDRLLVSNHWAHELTAYDATSLSAMWVAEMPDDPWQCTTSYGL